MYLVVLGKILLLGILVWFPDLGLVILALVSVSGVRYFEFGSDSGLEMFPGLGLSVLTLKGS